MSDLQGAMIRDLLGCLKPYGKVAKGKRGRPRKLPVIKKSVSQPGLVDYLSQKGVSSTIVNDVDSFCELTKRINNNTDHETIYVLVFATNSELAAIEIFILLVNEMKLESCKHEESFYIRFRCNQHSFVGRVMMKAKSLHDVQASTKGVMNRVSNLPGYTILKTKVVISVTKETEFINPDKFDARKLFLKQRLEEKLDASPVQASREIPESNQVNMEQGKRKTFDVLTLLSDQESEAEAREKSHKKSRLHKFSKLKVITKIRDQRVQLSKVTEINIVQLIDKLREIAPTLPASEHGTIFMKSLFQLIIEINTKLNCLKETRSHETCIPLDREIKISKVHGKEEIKLNDRINLPLLAYAKAIDADKPHLVVSRIIRFCFDTDFKLNCELNEEPNESNFLYRLGNNNLEGMERVEDGRDILDMIIEHAHMVKEYSSMTSQSYRESMQQVTKALYDCKRREIDRLGKVLEQEERGKLDFNQDDDTVEIQYEDLEAIQDKHDDLASNLLNPFFSFNSI